MPLWIVISFALRNMSGANPATGGIPSGKGRRVCFNFFALVPGLSTEGVLWFADLTAPDPLLILPVLISASNLLNIEVNLIIDSEFSQRPCILSKLVRREFF